MRRLYINVNKSLCILLVFIFFIISFNLNLSASEEFEYQTKGEIATLVRYTGFGGDVVIPPVINNGVRDCTVVYIGEYAFDNNQSVTSIHIPSTIIEIGQNAFTRCSSLKSITVDEKNENYRSDNGILYTYDKSSLLQYPPASTSNSFYLDDSVVAIAHAAFRGSRNLQEVHLSENLKIIGYYAFADCMNLTDIFIFDSTLFVGVDILKNTAWYYAQDDGLLYLNNVLYGYKGSLSGNIILKSSTVSVAAYAFNNSDITDVSYSENIKVTGEYAFRNCYKLKTVKMLDKMEFLGDYAFENCNNLTELTFWASSISFGVLSVPSKPLINCIKDSSVETFALDNGNPVSYCITALSPTIDFTYVGKNTITVSWADSFGAVSYNVYLNMSLYKNTTSSSVTFTGLDSDRAYFIYIKAVSAAGQEVKEDNIISVKTRTYIPGDFDLSGSVGISEAMILFRYVAGKCDFTDTEKMIANANADGRVNISDAMIIFRIVAGKQIM